MPFFIKLNIMRLGLNIDHIATLRNARGGVEPDVIEGALIAQACGVDGITTHLREDRRHIKDEDVFRLKEVLDVRLNLEMAATPEMQKIALELKPAACCIVPEKRQEVTTEGGLDVAGKLTYMRDFVAPLVDAGIQVSLFIDPNVNQVNAAQKAGANYIELHTGQYSLNFGTYKEKNEFEKLHSAASRASLLGLGVNAGHGLNYVNVGRMKELPSIDELNIGHSIISRAVFVGLENAIKEMQDLIG